MRHAWRPSGSRGLAVPLRAYSVAPVRRAYVHPQELERIARQAGAGADPQACRALCKYLGSASTDPKKVSIAQLALDALATKGGARSSALVSLEWAAHLATTPVPSLAGLQALQTKYPAWHPGAAEYTPLLHKLCRLRHPEALEVWQAAYNTGVCVTPSTTNALLSTALAHAPMASMREIVAQMGGVPSLDRIGLTTLLQGYVHRWADAEVLEDDASEWDEMSLRPTRDSAVRLLDAPERPEIEAVAGQLLPLLHESRDSIGWHAYIGYQCLFDDFAEILQTTKHTIEQGVLTPDGWTLSTLVRGFLHDRPPLRGEAALALLTELEAWVPVRPGRHVLTMLLHSVLGHRVRLGTRKLSRPIPDIERTADAHGFLDEATALYNVEPDAALLQPLLEAYCFAFVPAYDTAYALLQQLRAPPRRSILDRWRPKKAVRTDYGTYFPLLMACVRLRTLPRALALLSEMEVGVVPLHAGRALIQRLWSISSTYEEAWEVYQSVERLGGLDAPGYAALIADACQLSLAETAGGGVCPVPPALPLQILGDMRTHRFHPSPTTYTVLLQAYAKSPRATLASVQVTHELIKRDVHLEPDLILIHALMNAYNHVDAPAQVLGIWDSLVVLCTNTSSLRYMDEVSLVVVCDACGHAGLLSAARRAVETARWLDEEEERRSGGKRGRIVTKNALDAWVECLARCGQLCEAADVVFAMPDADAKTVGTLARFAAAAYRRGQWTEAQWQTLRENLTAEFPACTDTLAQIA